MSSNQAPTESARKKRANLPALLKLKMTVDIERLRAEFNEMETRANWDGLGAEYAGLCIQHDQLPPFFLKEGEQTHGGAAGDASYQQLALSEFDPAFDLTMRSERNGTFWDHKSPKNATQADERFYRKPVAGIPTYMASVLDRFRPALHRARFAKILPNSEVKPHIDYDTTYSVRLHIPIETSAECLIGINAPEGIIEQHLPADGSIWFLNQGHKHWATNPTTKPRVHLILSIDSQSVLEW